MFMIWWNDGELTNYLCAVPAGAWVNHKCRAGTFDSHSEAAQTAEELRADAAAKEHTEWTFG